MRTVPVSGVDGAVAVAGGELAVGTYGGCYARFSYPGLELLVEERVCAVSVNGVQFAGGQSAPGLVLLTQDEDRSFATPADWDQALLYLGGSERRRVALGPGNWKLVHGREGVHAVVYDVTEGQGVRAVTLGPDPRRLADGWALRRTFGLIVADAADRLLATTETALTIVDARDGAVLAEHEFPVRTATCWTAVAAHGDGFLLGGYVLPARDHYVLAHWHPGRSLRTGTVPLNAVFTPEQVGRALECEATCGGADIFRVAAIRVGDDGQVVIAFGGDERITACPNACAIARLDVRDLRVGDVRLVDAHESATALRLASDGGVIVDCSGTVAVLPRSW
jgi:hypothetical protein